MQLHCERIGRMPKKVDHLERRSRIAGALMRVAAKDGLEAVSLRHVATEAGVSSGMVQHYFRTKDEMMAFALTVIREHIQARIDAAVGVLGASPSPRSLLRTILGELLPLDEPRRADGRVALAFLAYTAVRPGAAASLREDTAAMVAFVADLIRSARADGEIRAGVDPAHAAAGLLAAAEGLALYVLSGTYPADVALAALDAQLALIFRPND
jgi:AcrR family transcriptional regulator